MELLKWNEELFAGGWNILEHYSICITLKSSAFELVTVATEEKRKNELIMKNTFEKENYVGIPMQKTRRKMNLLKTKMVLHAPQIINYKILNRFFFCINQSRKFLKQEKNTHLTVDMKAITSTSMYNIRIAKGRWWFSFFLSLYTSSIPRTNSQSLRNSFSW